MPDSPQYPARDYRADAAVVLAALHPRTRDRIADVLVRHHEAERLPDPHAIHTTPRLALTDLLWDELAALERDCVPPDAVAALAGRRSALEYWQRRRQVARWRSVRAALADAPMHWRRLLELSAAQARDVCVALGLHMIAAAAQGRTREDLLRWLTPLGGKCGAGVVELLRQADPARQPAWDPPLVERWRTLYDRIARHRQADSIASAMGRVLLRTLYDRLNDEQRDAVAQIARSNLCAMLEQTEPHALDGDAQAKAVESLVQKILAKVR
jgi:hypothetical protein